MANGRSFKMTSFLTIIILFFLSACNPLAPSATESKIDSNHRPGVDQTSDDASVSAATGLVSTSSASVTADGSTTATITITVKNISGANLSGKVVSLSSSRGVIDTISTISATTDSSGNASFSISSSTSGSSTLTAIADGITLTQTTSVTFSNGSVSSIVFSTQPSNSGNTDSNLTVQPVIELKDSFGNTVTSDSASTITLEGHSNASCSAVVASGISATTNPVTTVSGVAIFAAVKVLKTNVIRIKASDGTRSVCSNAVSISPGAAASISFLTQPSTTGDTDTNLVQQPVIQSLDANGNVRTSDSTSSINLEGHSNASCTATVASGISATTNPVTSAAGVATFAAVKVLKTNVIRIKATDGTRTFCSNAISISAGAAASLAFSTQPSTTGDTDTNLAQQPVVTVYDANGNIKTGHVGSITISANSNSMSCSVVSDVASGLSATTNPVTTSSGVSTFAGVKVLKTNAVRLRATDGTLEVCSDTFLISPGAISSLAFSTQPASTGDTDTVLSTQPVIQLLDANGNIRTSDSTSTITLDAHSNAGCTATVASGISATTNPVTAVAGVATFAAVKVLKTNAIRIKATDGTRSVCSNAISISPGAINSISFTTQPAPATRSADTPFTTQPVISAYDANSNLISNLSIGSVTLTTHTDTSCASGAISSGIVATTNPVTFSSGVATFAGVHVQKTNAIRIKASDGTRSACSDALTISVGALSTSLSTLTASPLSLAADNSTTSTFTATIMDQYSNLISGQSVTLASSRGATDTIATSPATTNSSGVATLTVKSSTVGNPNLTLTAGSFSQTRKLYFLSYTPLLDYQARYAKLGSAPGDTTINQWWKDLKNLSGSTTYDLELFGFPTTNASWTGNGGSAAATDPYRLTLSSASSQYLDGTTDLNSGSDAYVETWIRPSSISTKSSVILANGDSSNKGLILMQDAASPGKVTLKLGSTKTYVEEVMADSPIAYWRLGEVGATATAINIGSSSSVNGTYTGGYTYGVTPSISDSDYAVTLNGSTGYVNVGNLSPFQFTLASSFSLEAWINPIVDSTSRFIVGKNASTAVGGGYHLRITSSNTLRFIVNSSASVWKYVDTGVISSVWQHVVATWDGSNPKIYINGTLSSGATQTQGSLTSISTTSNFIIGAAADLLQYFRGSIDEVAVYNTELSQVRAQAHYDARTRPTCTSLTTLTNSSWSYLSALFNSTTGVFRLFIDGSQECSMTLASPSSLYTGSTSPIASGASVNSSGTVSSGSYWSGDIGEIRGANTTLTNSQIIDNYNTSAVNYPTFSPSSISGLTLWYAADDLTTLFKTSDCTTTAVTTDGDAVGCWKNKASSSYNLIQAASGNQPTYVASSINSKPGIRFGLSGVKTFLATSSITLHNRTGFAVTRVRGSSVGLYHSVLLQIGSPFYQIYASTGGNWIYYTGAANSVSATATGNQLHSFMNSNTNYSYRINSSIIKSGAAAMTSVNNVFEVGGYSGSTYCLNGDIVEVIIYNTVLTETEIKKVEAYLNAKYKVY
jgi:hypothetical protein